MADVTPRRSRHTPMIACISSIRRGEGEMVLDAAVRGVPVGRVGVNDGAVG